MVTKGLVSTKVLRDSRKHCLPLTLQSQDTLFGVIMPPVCNAIKESVTLRNYLIISSSNFCVYEIWAKYEILTAQGITTPLFKHIIKNALSTPLELTPSHKMLIPSLVAKIRLAKGSLTRPEAVW